MDAETVAKPIDRRALHAWFSRVPGREIALAQRGQLDRVLSNLFGYHLVQVGSLGDLDLLSNSRVLNRNVIEIDGLEQDQPYPVVRGSATALPIESDTVDVVVLPHILEFEAQPHEALRESARVLVPEGHLVICGFNPWSMMGCWRYLKGRQQSAPWSGRFLALTRLRDWLALLGFDVTSQTACFFKPPFSNERLLKRLDFLDRIGTRMPAYFAGAYLVLAQKRVTTLTPIRSRWRPRRRLVAVGLVGPSARVADGLVERE
ncbi:MAG: methyltransferase domain-containing protein [Gammaproteobacteria bacterium]|nr:methyltransferase domain-containing protein [Gammaproteobacteria bacterium]NIM73954.1 methyltransferase domain-containing protein [Gammaproteobacteria bacterium]NIN38142.1 methyltransferase domain-containing protein [Gammaproteobacteria bacterium]NIO25735.1 methyltransferase domain-containing protein [Gammaproteobacteria bacterium]NIO66369.1 methyltransferase domain-containing protein [Gammaproteobacteria bacterium]